MEDRKLTPLPDEALDTVAGGSGVGIVVVTCTSCREGQIGIPDSGPWAEACPKCGATIICYNGRVQYSIPQPQQPAPDVDTDDSWL